jgi:ABC-type polar amino acid transport system ATPase subunit
MKPLGIRFENFACFDECFLPLESGVQILVGKNNSGKTALLRGLTALRSLPIDEVLTPATDLGKYARQAVDGSGFNFRVECSFDDADHSTIGGALGQSTLWTEATQRQFEFRFRLLAGTSEVGLVDAALKLDQREYKVLVRENQMVVLQQYNQHGQLAGRSQLRTTNTRQINNENWPVLAPAPIFSPLMSFKNMRMIEAHRVVRPESNMQAVDALSPNAESLAPFLDTLFGNNRRKFQEIEQLLIRVFPEIESVNPEKRQNSVSLTLTNRKTGQAIPLTHSGTGVEQVLALATFVLASPPGGILLMDEPHSYLHPSAEREIVSFLSEHLEHRYVISTHSTIFINSVPPDRVILLNSPKIVEASHSQSTRSAEVLHALGYRNSDFLFSDRLIFVEGESDQEILPMLLTKGDRFDASDVARTGFPKMDGEGRLRGTSKQTSLIYFEKFLEELGSSALPRIYLFDGDCEQCDRRVLQDTPLVAQKDIAGIRFLSMSEIENYLLVPEAILAAVQHIFALQGKDSAQLTREQIARQLQDLLAADNGKLYPRGRDQKSTRSVKGSVVLRKIFEQLGLKYTKANEGRLVAEYITLTNQPALSEIWDLVAPIFPKPGPKH